VATRQVKWHGTLDPRMTRWVTGPHSLLRALVGCSCKRLGGSRETAWRGRRLTAHMTPLPVLPGPWNRQQFFRGRGTGNRGTRRRAPVSDRPVIGLSVGVVAATVRRPQVSVQEAAVSLLQKVLFYVGDRLGRRNTRGVRARRDRPNQGPVHDRAHRGQVRRSAGPAGPVLAGDPAEVAGRDRTPRRAARRCAVGGRVPGRPGQARTRSRRGGTEKCCPAPSPTPVTPQ